LQTAKTQRTAAQGESEGNRPVVDDFIMRVAADSVSGGSFTYIGWDMKSAYAGKDITNAKFDALVGDLVTALNKFNIGARSQLASLFDPCKSTEAFLTHHHKEEVG
jgi:hypothetical protein